MPSPALSNSHLHPTFAAILNAARNRASEDARQAQVAAYEKALQDHDWQHEFSDDHSVYQRGHNALSTLRMLRRELDPSGDLWNKHAPAGHRLQVDEVQRLRVVGAI